VHFIIKAENYLRQQVGGCFYSEPFMASGRFTGFDVNLGEKKSLAYASGDSPEFLINLTLNANNFFEFMVWEDRKTLFRFCQKRSQIYRHFLFYGIFTRTF